MLNITKKAADRVDIELGGKLDADGMRMAMDDLLAASEGVLNGLMLYKILDFALPTAGAIAVEMSYIPKLFGLLGKFDNCAVVCDLAWVRTAAEIEGAVFPGIEIKSFRFDELTAAEEWLSASKQ